MSMAMTAVPASLYDECNSQSGRVADDAADAKAAKAAADDGGAQGGFLMHHVRPLRSRSSLLLT